MQQTQGLLGRLEELADQWRAAQGSPAAERLVDEYRRTLATLMQTGWRGSIGWKHELPDQYLLPEYINARTQLIERLLDQLSNEASNWRGAKPGSPEKLKWLETYHATMEELFRTGHWSGEPDVDSQLPRALMPEVYKKFWEEQLKS